MSTSSDSAGPTAASASAGKKTEPTDRESTSETAEMLGAVSPTLRHRSVALRRRYRHSHDQLDIDASVHFGQQAVAAALAGPELPGALADLANALRVRFVGIGNTSDRKDIDEAVALAEQAVAAAVELRSERPWHWSTLSLTYRTRYRSLQDVADIDRAVEAAQRAVDLEVATPHGGRLTALATNLRLRYTRTGHMADANGSVRNAQRAVAATPGAGPRRAGRLSVLAAARGARYSGTHQLDDIDKSIEALREALEITERDPRARKNRWANLGIALRIRAERTKSSADLNEAAKAARIAMLLTPQHDPQRALVVVGLASALGSRYEHLHDAADVDEALTLMQSVITDAASGAGAKATRNADYSALLRLRANREHDPESAALAVIYATRATQLLPAGSAEGTNVWSTLGSAHATLHEITGELQHAREAIRAWLRSGLTVGPPPARLYSLYAAGMLGFKIGSYDTAARAFANAVDLLSDLAWVGLTRDSQEAALRQFQVVASSAAAAQLQQGAPILALEALERGRHVLWSSQLNLDADTAVLAERAPELADALTTCARRLGRQFTP